MRILHIITRLNKGGTSNWLQIITDKLVKEGHQVFLIHGEIDKNEIQSETLKNITEFQIKGFKRKINLISDIKTTLKIMILIYRIKPDIINTHTSKAGLLGRVAILPFYFGYKPKVVHTFHGHLLYGYFSNLSSFFFLLIERALSKITDGFIVSGQTVADNLVHKRILQGKKFICINPPMSQSIKLKYNVRDYYKFSKEDILVSWLGRFEKVKCPDRVIELSILFPRIKFVMSGNGSLYDHIKRIAPKNVYLTGWVNPDFIWSGTDIALLTSLNEAVPFVLVESSSHQVPAIAENVGSVKDIIENNFNGFLTSNLKDRISALQLLSKSVSIREKMGHNARSLVEEKFSEKMFISSHLDFYSELVNSDF